MHRLFIYGTLKLNESNYFHMTEGGHGEAVFVGKGTTSKKYPLLLIPFKDAGGIPGMVYQEGVGHNIDGEIWDVDETFLKWLDDFEGCPDWYQRETINVTCADNSREEICFVYVRRNVEITESSKLLKSFGGATT